MMRNTLIKTTILFAFLLGLSGCLDPNYYIWKNMDAKYNESLPWSGIDKKPERQYTKYLAPMSGTGYGSDRRWRISFFDKRQGYKIADEAGEYLVDNGIAQRWGFKRYSDGDGIFHSSKSMYELTIISISPVIITMRPYINIDLNKKYWDLKHPKSVNHVISDYFQESIHYGTSLKYQKNLLFFSPDLDILPQPLNLKNGNSKTIYWNRLLKSGAVEFVEKNGVVYTRRLNNKEGKDFKKDGYYNSKYHLSLVDSEKATMLRWKEIKKKNKRKKRYQDTFKEK